MAARLREAHRGSSPPVLVRTAGGDEEGEGGLKVEGGAAGAATATSSAAGRWRGESGMGSSASNSSGWYGTATAATRGGEEG